MGTKNFATVDLGDRRRHRRLIRSAARIAEHPGLSFNQLFDWNDLRGFYGLCHQEKATLPALQATHWHLTRQAMAEEPLVLILHDTTELDFTGHHALQGAGPVGTGEGRGFLQHNSLAVVPAPRRVLGLAFQQWHVRQPAPQPAEGKEHTSQRKRRDRESQLWTNGIKATGRPPAGCRWVNVGDRAADIYEAMVEADEAGQDFLFRVAQNREVRAAPGAAEFVKLQDYARGLPSGGRGTVDIPGRGGRAARQAEVHMAAAPVWVPAPQGTRGRADKPTVAAWVVRVWEADPPAGVEPLEWLLLTSVPTATVEELEERREWYACRWMLEVFHDIEKNGCGEEDRRFETADRMEACLAILSVVAVRVFQLRTALDHQPDAPAEQVATAAEIEVARQVAGPPVLARRGVIVTVRDFVRAVASLGGFLGRTGDGDPGVKTLWRGYQRLQDLLLGYQLRPPRRKDVGNR